MEVSWSELLVIGIVALVIIGPKDLPGMFRELGRFTAKLRAMSRDFSRAMEQAAKETGVADVADDLRKVTNPKSMGLDAVRSAADKFEKWDPLKPAAKPATAAAAPLTPAPMPGTPVVALGPATAALAEEVATKRKASAGKAAELAKAKAASAVKTPAAPLAAAAVAAPDAAPDAAPVTVAEPAPVEPPAAKRAGRVRKKPVAGEAT